jgi:hypothetical protein
MGAVVEAEVYTSAKVALLVKVVAIAIVVIEPTPAASGRAMMLRCLQPQMVALENKMADLAGGIPLILGYHKNGSLTPSPFPFLPLILSGLNQGKLLLREAIVGL